MRVSQLFSKPVYAAERDVSQEKNLRPVKRKSLQKCNTVSQGLFLCPSLTVIFCSFLLIYLHKVFCLKNQRNTKQNRSAWSQRFARKLCKQSCYGIRGSKSIFVNSFQTARISECVNYTPPSPWNISVISFVRFLNFS